jgi:FkbM family methyltransferase
MKKRSINGFVILSILFMGVHLHSNELRLVRLGTDYGGWTIPADLLHEGSVCYSFGVGEDISFDIELIRHVGCTVFLFDPTPRSIEHIAYVKENIGRTIPAYINNSRSSYLLDHSRLNKLIFHSYGLWHKDEKVPFFAPKNPKHVSYSIVNLQHTKQYFTVQCKKLSTIMKELGHESIDLLKMDIEGAEYMVLQNMIEEKIFPTILCIELHALEVGIEEAAIQILKAHGYDVVYKNGKTDYTFIRK